MAVTRNLARRLKDLAGDDPSRRRAAADALAASDARAVYPLVKALSDGNPGVQDAAMRSLISIGGEATAYAVLPLLRAEAALRNTAVIILKEIGTASLPLLRPLLFDKDEDVRKFAVDLIGAIGRCDYPDDVIGVLRRDTNPNVRASAARVLGSLGCRKALPDLIRALTDEEWVCFSALDALSALGDEVAAVALESILGSPSEAVRYGAIEALGRVGSPLASDALMVHLETARGFEKRATLKSLVQAGITPHMFEVSGMLIDMLLQGDWDERLVAVRGLVDLRDEGAVRHIVDVAGSLDRSAPENEDRVAALKEGLKAFGCTDALIAVLRDPETRHRGRTVAVEVAGELGCGRAAPELLALLNSGETEVRRACISALGPMEGEDVLQALMGAVRDEDGHVRSASVRALGERGEKRAFGSILDQLTVEQYDDVIRMSVEALVRIDEGAFTSALGRFGRLVRQAAAHCMTDVGSLLALSREEDPSVRSAALAGLGRAGGRTTAERLIEALGDTEADVRRAAVDSLGVVGFGFDAVLSALEDRDLWVRIAAVKALAGFRDQDWAVRLIRFSTEPDVPVALAALETLAGATEQGGAPPIALFADHPDPEVRSRARALLEQSW